jgi:hypothetical protein
MRFYLEATDAPAISPAFDAAWGQTTSAIRRKMSVNKSSWSVLTEKTTPGETSATEIDALNAQFISEPLDGDQTITGTVKGIIKALQGGAAAATGDTRAQLVIRVVSNDGSIVRGTLLAADTGSLASEFTSAMTARKYPKAWSSPGATLTSVAALHGDRIVIEVGGHHHNVITTASTNRQEFGSGAARELPENETDQTADAVGWIEFSQGFAFQGQARVITSRDLSTVNGPSSVPTNPTLTPWGVVAVGWLGLLFSFAKPETLTRTVPTGFTQEASGTGGTGVAGADTGPLCMFVDSKVLAGSESGNISHSWTTTPSAAGHCLVKYDRYDGVSSAWDLEAVTASDTTTGTGALSVSGTPATDPGFQAGDRIVVVYANPSDAGTFSTPAFTVPGCTLSAPRELDRQDVTGGTDLSWLAYEATIISGTSTGPPTFTLSSTVANSGAGVFGFVRIR